MLKYLTGFVIVFGLAVYVSVQDERASQQDTANAAQLDKAAVSTTANEEQPQEHVKDSKRNLPRWYGFFRWPDGTTTWAILLTLMAIAEQTQETRNAAQATRDSVLLQEKAMQQWIDLANWKANVLQLIPGEPGLLSIQVDVVNPTAFPVKITGGSILFKNPAGFKDALDFPAISVTPNLPYEAGVTVEVTEQQVVNFAIDPIPIIVFGMWSHIGALDKPVSQALAGTLYCTQNSTVFTPKLHMNPIESDTEGHRRQANNPN